MRKIRLGKTDMMVTKTSFGVLPLQRVPMGEAVNILQKAYDYGINYYDTANAYSDSEEKIGNAFKGGRRENIYIATKSGATTKDDVMAHIELSLKRLQTDYIDLIQLHNPKDLPDPNDKNSSYAALLEAKEKGYVRHIGITNHRLPVALEAIESGLYETLQFPFCYLASDDDIRLVNRCKELDIGFVAMKGLSGGLLTNAAACAAFMEQYDNVVPIWGIQRMSELDEWVMLEQKSNPMTDDIRAVIEQDKKELAGDFCRGCGYCMPCPVDIEINMAARMKMLLRRSPYLKLISDEGYEKMHRIDNCLHCNQCSSKCPYDLDTPRLLRDMLVDYDEFYAEHKHEVVR